MLVWRDLNIHFSTFEFILLLILNIRIKLALEKNNEDGEISFLYWFLNREVKYLPSLLISFELEMFPQFIIGFLILQIGVIVKDSPCFIPSYDGSAFLSLRWTKLRLMAKEFNASSSDELYLLNCLSLPIFTLRLEENEKKLMVIRLQCYSEA